MSRPPPVPRVTAKHSTPSSRPRTRPGTLWRWRQDPARLTRRVTYLVVLALVALVALRTDWGRLGRAFFDPSIFVAQFPEVLTRAARNTLVFTVLGFSGGLLIGLAIALMRLSRVRAYRWFAVLYIEVFRGLPALLTILLVGFALPIALGVRIPFTYGPGSVALAIVSGAYIAETLRAGIQAVPAGQVEAATALGLSPAQAMSRVVLPQAFRIVIPPLTNELVLLIKDTSLIGIVLGTTAATRELVKFANDAVSRSFNATPLVVVGLVYLAMTVPLTRLARLLERRLGAGS